MLDLGLVKLFDSQSSFKESFICNHAFINPDESLQNLI